MDRGGGGGGGSPRWSRSAEWVIPGPAFYLSVARHNNQFVKKIIKFRTLRTLRLRAARSAVPGTLVPVPEVDIVFVLVAARRALLEGPALLRLAAPLNICGKLNQILTDMLGYAVCSGRRAGHRRAGDRAGPRDCD